MSYDLNKCLETCKEICTKEYKDLSEWESLIEYIDDYGLLYEVFLPINNYLMINPKPSCMELLNEIGYSMYEWDI